MKMLSARARACIQDAKKRWGTGWRQLSPEMREAAVCRELVYLALAQFECSEVVMRHLIQDFQQALTDEAVTQNP